MKRRAVPVVDDDEHGVGWLADAGTFRGALAEIQAGTATVSGHAELNDLCRARRSEAVAWCEARGLDYEQTRRAAIRQQTTDREERS